MSWYIWVPILFASPILLYIVMRILSAAVFESYFESKFKHSILKGDFHYGEEEDKKRKI